MILINPFILGGSGGSFISAQYWRINISTGNAGSNVSIAELEFLDGGGSVISTSGATCTASSVFPLGSTYEAAKAIDTVKNNDNNRWASNGLTNQWLKIAYSGPVTARTVKVYPWANGGNQSDTPKDFKFQYSTDDSTWIDIGSSYTGYTTGWVQSTGRTFTLQ